MVLGGIVIPDDKLVSINQALQKYRREEHIVTLPNLGPVISRDFRVLG